VQGSAGVLEGCCRGVTAGLQEQPKNSVEWVLVTPVLQGVVWHVVGVLQSVAGVLQQCHLAVQLEGDHHRHRTLLIHTHLFESDGYGAKK
jgi:hypothetical protein